MSVLGSKEEDFEGLVRSIMLLSPGEDKVEEYRLWMEGASSVVYSVKKRLSDDEYRLWIRKCGDALIELHLLQPDERRVIIKKKTGETVVVQIQSLKNLISMLTQMADTE